ncbi:MAG: ATP-grasp domain-containing protein, partial [Methanobacteriaceae archaeon]
MEKLLILGVNTRPLVNSALKLNYKVYSGSYFKTYDFKEPHIEKHVLNQQGNKSSGYFENNYSYQKILELYEDDVYGEVDNIILYTGISPNNLPNHLRKKILGNKDTKDIENKYKFYKKIKKIKKNLETKQTANNENNENNENIKFCIPKTFKASDILEAVEIANQHNHLQFIAKPIEGSGGYGVNYLNNLASIGVNSSDNISGFETGFENPFILQEYIKGINVSSSVLSTGKIAKTIFSSYNNT